MASFDFNIDRFLDSQLTEHFSLREMVKTSYHYVTNVNSIDVTIIRHLFHVACFLEFIRKHMNDIPIIVSSGFRCSMTNLAVGGSAASYHKKGLAVDFHFKHKNNSTKLGELYSYLKSLFDDDLPFGYCFQFKNYLIHSQCIREVILYRHKVNGNQWIHVSLSYEPDASSKPVFMVSTLPN